jgi:hypothetical protein
MNEDVDRPNRGLLTALIAGSLAGAAMALLLAPVSNGLRRRQLVGEIRDVLRARARARVKAGRRLRAHRPDKDRTPSVNPGPRAAQDKERARS